MSEHDPVRSFARQTGFNPRTVLGGKKTVSAATTPGSANTARVPNNFRTHFILTTNRNLDRYTTSNRRPHRTEAEGVCAEYVIPGKFQTGCSKP
jgi:hypothetical protein